MLLPSARDFRHAIRTLLAARGFTLAAVITLGVGMTLSTTAMTVFKAYLLSDLPYPAAERLYWVRYAAPGQEGPRGLASLDWPSLSDVVEHPVAWDLDMFYLLGGGHAESAPGAWVTKGFIEALGVRPALGRTFDDEAFAAGGENVALISHRLWRSRYGGDPGVVGQTFAAYVSDRPNETERFRIAGVLPEDFWHINPYTDVITPLRAPAFPYMVRLHEGVTPAAASDRIASLVRQGATNIPPQWSVTLVSAHDAHVATIRPMLKAAIGAAALVLLVACANVAGLLLVRAARRRHEIAVRAALGAGRRAIARMLFAEALVLGAAATIVAVVATSLLTGALAPVVQQRLGRPAPGDVLAFTIDWRVLIFAAGVGMATSILCTVVPMAAMLRPQLLPALQGRSRGATEGRASRRARGALVAIEVALSVVLLAGSAAMLRSVAALLRTDLGFSAERVMTGGLTLRQNRYPDAASRVSVFDRISRRIAAAPGVESVGLTTAWPLQQPRSLPVETVDATQSRSLQAAIHAVNDAYFTTLGIPVAAGRAFQPSDRPESEPVAIVSRSLASQLWPGGQALGNRVLIRDARDEGEPVAVRRLVVGVANDVRQGPTDTEQADLYVPMPQAATRFTFLLVRTAGAAEASLPLLRSALRDIDPELAFDRARPLGTIAGQATAGPRFMTVLLAAFGASAAIMALVGVYAVIAFAVRQREREIAVRLALGADPRGIVRLFLRQGGAVLLWGLAIGGAAAIPAGRLIESQLFGVTPRDPLAIGAALCAFGAAGLVAIWWPARRAAATEPVTALRAE
jgi:predicted permease